MPLADSNIWVALAITEHVFHTVASEWVSQVSAEKPVLFCRATQQSFLRILTTKSVFAPFGLPPRTNKEAWETYQRFRANRQVGFALEPPQIEPLWKKLTSNNNASPKFWMDAYLAAFAIAGRHQLVATDKGFRQFKQLDLVLL